MNLIDNTALALHNLNMRKNFYLYVHRKNNGEIFYVGKGTGDRAYRTNGRSKHWHRFVAKHGLVVEIVAPNISEHDAFCFEISAIALCRNMAAKLVNVTGGGEGNSGWNPSQETRINMSKNNVFKRPEFIQMMKEKKLGFKHSEKTKKRIAESSKGRAHSEESKRKISLANAGKKRTEEARQKMSFSQKGKKRSQEIKNQMSIDRKGRIITDETKIKISISKKKPVICSNGMNFDSATDAALYLGKKVQAAGNISSCCNGKLKTAYGHNWKFLIENEH